MTSAVLDIQFLSLSPAKTKQEHPCCICIAIVYVVCLSFGTVFHVFPAQFMGPLHIGFKFLNILAI